MNPDQRIAIAGEAIPTSRSDKLRVLVVNTVASGTVYIRIVQVDGRGEISYTTERIAAASAGQQVAATYSLTDGFLISVDIYTDNETSPWGRIWAEAYFQRGDVFNFNTAFPLIAGYVGKHASVRWPIDRPKSVADIVPDFQIVNGAAPAAGENPFFFDDTFYFTELFWASFTLTASAAVANRRVRVLIYAQGSITSVTESRIDQTASQTRTYYLWQGPNMPADFDTRIFIPFPDLPAVSELGVETLTSGLDIADQFSFIQVGVTRRVNFL